MSENNNKEQSHGGQSAPRVARSASSQPLIGKEQIQTHEGVSAAPTSGVKVREKVERQSAPRARRTSPSLARLDAWSVAKEDLGRRSSPPRLQPGLGGFGKVCLPPSPPVPVV